MRPNIFDIATKELSQDAFITWLLKFADDKYRETDPKLNECGKEFVTQLIKKQIPDFNETITTVEAGRQWENIDIWAKVNSEYLIIIEDKTNSSQHGDQLSRYEEFAKKWCIENNFKKLICIYLKTGNESLHNLSKVEKEGFYTFSRQEIINLLDQLGDISNNIFKDFHERLKRLEKINNEFESKALKDWNSNDWQGFYQYLETATIAETKIANWGYANNPSGGVWYALFEWEYWKGYPVYLQVEQGKLCFKIVTDPNQVKMPENTTKAEIRNQFYHLIMEKSRNKGLNIRKPDRFGNGNYMTAAIVDRKNWFGADEEKLEKDKVVKELSNYLTFFLDAIKQ